MPNAVQLSARVRQSLAEQIAQRTTTMHSLTGGDLVPELGESFQEFLLTRDSIKTGSGPLAERAVDIGRWHHQIYLGDHADSAAASIAAPTGSVGDQKLVAVSQSTLPAALKRTIDWIDANIEGSSTAVLLMVPDYFLSALWLRGAAGVDQVVIAVMGRPVEGLAINTPIAGDAFLAALAASPEIVGLPPLPAPDNPPSGNAS